jgi:hypothetical protein
MTAAEALAEIRGLAAAGRVEFTDHAREEMEDASADFLDVLNALRKATSCRYQKQKDRWKVVGPDLDADDLTIVVALDDGVLVVTVW